MTAALADLVTVLLGGVFSLTALARYPRDRRPHQLAWAIAFALFAAASGLQLVWLAGVGEEFVFRLWYLIAVLLVAAFLGAGSVLFLLPRLGAAVTVALAVVTVVAVMLTMAVPLRAEVDVLAGGPLRAKQPGTALGLYPSFVENAVWFLSLPAGLALVAGALATAVGLARRRSGVARAVTALLVLAGAGVSQDLDRFGAFAWLFGLALVYLGLRASREVFPTAPGAAR